MINTTKTKLGKKLLSWLLVLVMALSVLPTAAFAIEDKEPPSAAAVTTDFLDGSYIVNFGYTNSEWIDAIQSVSIDGTPYVPVSTSYDPAFSGGGAAYIPRPSNGELVFPSSLSGTVVCVIEAKGYEKLTLQLDTAGKTAEVVDTSEPAYVLMNIPYAAFYAAEGDQAADIDAITSATKSKTMNANLAANSYHVSDKGEDITGITYPVYVEHSSVLKNYTEVDSRDDLFCNVSYAYFVLDEVPASYKKLTLEDGGPVFGKATGAVETVEASAVLSTGGRHTFYEIKVTGLEHVSATNVSGVTLHTAAGSVYGLRHVYEIWRGTELGFDVTGANGDYTGLQGQTINKITYYLNDGSIYAFDTDINVPARADAGVLVNSVDAGAESTTFTLNGGLPDDFKAQYSVNLENAEVDSTSGTITLPADAAIGTYTLTITDENGKYAPITASFSVYGYVLMNIPYDEFYAAETVKSGDKAVSVDAVTSATAKAQNSALAGGSYHVMDENGNPVITGVTYPVQISDTSVLEGYKEVTDTDSFTYEVNNRGQVTTTTYTGKDTLFGSPSYAYYVLSEKPSAYKTLTKSRRGISFGKSTAEAQDAGNVTTSLATNNHFTYYVISVKDFDKLNVQDVRISGVTLHTTDGEVYGLRHVSQIWRGTELGFDDHDYAALQGKTIDKITYYLNENGTYSAYAINVDDLLVLKSTKGSSVTAENALASAGKTTVEANLPKEFQASYQVTKGGVNLEEYDFSVNNGELTWRGEPGIGAYTLTVTDSNGAYAPVSTTFELQTNMVYARYDAVNKKLAAADGVSEADFNAYLKAISAVLVDETSYAASGRGAVTIVNKETGAIDLTTAPFAKGDNAYDVVVKATGYQDLAFLLTAGEVTGSGILPGVAGKNGTTYIGLFEPCIFKEKYDQLWHDYTAAIVGASGADATVENYLKFAIGGNLYGQEAIDAVNVSGQMQFCCELINGADTITFNGDRITVKDSDGTVLSDHTYTYLGTATVGSAPMSFQGDLYMADKDAGEFTYFLMRDDTPDETYHIEFRYGSDLGQLKGYLTGDYAYWLAAGIPQDADQTMIENVIALFCLENMDYSQRSAESLTQITDLAGTWDYYENGTAKPATLYFTVDENGNGQSYYQGSPSASYQVYAYDNDGKDDQKSGIYVTYDEEGPEWAKYTITTSGSKTLLTLTGVADGYTLTYVKHTSDGGSHSGSGSSSATYPVSVDSSRNGSVSVSPRNASKGDTVTITVKLNSGYELDDLTVTDKNGDNVKLTKKSDTKYTFTMPASKVSVAASFVQSAAPDTGLAFTDVAAGAYYYDAVKWAVENGITGGTTAATFSPNASCTRAQVVTFLWRAAGSPAPKSGSNPFTDVQPGAYYYDAVLWAVEQGITAGTTADTFSPDRTVTRGQVVTFLHRSAGSPAAASGTSFTDVEPGAYYAGAVQWAVEQGITSGTTASAFSPNAPCTRAQIVTFLYRAR